MQQGKKCYKESKKVLRWKYISIHSEQHSKKCQIGKRQAMTAYMDTGFKNSLPSMTDRQSK